MKIFNLENPPKSKPAASTECVVIATFEEWQMICEAVEAAAKASPRKKKLAQLNETLEYLAIY